ncbi:MAG: ShlB/FhaC/HecB family hemolysin secretion/activation protein [Candidatus Competibacteraceae bacterium]|nr:ShlB/FhaC/HecB family hemolysin secretion/activation protein [Candidatus Competibacteraceae bacterium]
MINNIDPNNGCRPFVCWVLYGAALSLMTGLPLNAGSQEMDAWEPQSRARSWATPDYARPAAPALSPSPAPPPSGESPLSTRERVVVRQFELTGNTVFSAEELAAVTAPYINRALTAEELQEVRRQLTLYYVERGYLNSGAVIPDQPVGQGIVRIRIVEGRLSEMDVTGNTHLPAAYFQDRLRPDADAPLNVQELQDRLQRLQQNPLIEQLQAELAPGVQPGEGVLQLGVRENRPYEIGFAVANNNPPSVGATRAYLYGLDRNLTGVGDSLGLSYGHSLESSTADWRVFYARPLNARDTTVQVWAERNETSVIEDRFDTLDITSTLQTYGLSLTQPVYQTPQQSFSLGMNLERRHSESYLGGTPFPFTSDKEDDGQATVALVRLDQEWLDRRLDQVIAARSTFSFGLDAFGATVRAFEPDGQFVAWLGQFQWARRFGERDYQVIFKAILQLADDPLLPMEKCALGGLETVRGYPENTLVRDQCFVTSLEFRVPVYELPLAGVSRGPNEGQVQLAAFADYGWAKNKGEFDLDPNSIYSAGVGVRWDPSTKIHAALYWGYPFQEVNVGDEGWLSPRVNFMVQAAY